MVDVYPAEIYIAIGVFIILDIVTGFTQAVYNETVDSKILRNGMFHKLSYIFAIVLSLSLEYTCSFLELGFDCKVFVPLAIYIIATEGVSILENIVRINPDLMNSPIFKLLSENKNRRADDNDE